MRITLNGQEKDVAEGATLQSLLAALSLAPGRLACEVNREIVRRANYGETVLKDGDEVEVVQMIGGG